MEKTKRPHPRQERTFLMIKPDGVGRGLTGEIIRRIEQRGLKIIALSLLQANRNEIDRHYPKDPAWIRRLGEKSLATYEKYGYDPVEELGTADPTKIGQMVRNWLVDFMTSGPMVKMVVQGVHAIDMVRKLAGATMPSAAELGSIRGDFSIESAVLANMEKRAVHNLVHASETPEEAANEIKLWFNEKELHAYTRTDDAF